MTTINTSTTTLNDYTVTDLVMIKEAALQHARDAGVAHIEQYGEQAYCGFAWVTIHPEHKGNTRLGKLERRVIESMGFRKDWTGKAYQLWNCTGYGGQSMDVKEAGAQAYADVLRTAGFKAYMGSRAD